MSDEIPTAKSRRTPAVGAENPVVVTPATETGVVETPAAAASAEPALVEPAAVAPVEVAPVETKAEGKAEAKAEAKEEAKEAHAAEDAPLAHGTATGEVAPVETVAAPTGSGVAGQVVYVTAPIPPRVRGNRVVGSLLAILGAIIFAGLYGVVSGLIIDLQSGDLFGPTFGSFLGSAFFWVPGLVFLVGLVLLTLILNRAGWWAHVLGSLVLAIAVYFGMIGVLLLIGNVFHGSPKPITFAALAINPWVIAAAIVAREVSIWIGLAIAARGRRVKARNVETRAAFDREQEDKKAEYNRDIAA
jgi:hypothetical protein